MLPELVIFDMDGLIFDSERAHMEVLQEICLEHGLELTEEDYVKTLGLSRADTLQVMKGIFGPEVPYGEIAAEGRRRLNARAQKKSLPVKPGIKELLGHLGSMGIPACVASSSPRKTVEIYLDSSGLAPAFDFIMSGDDITHSKPDPEIFLQCCRHYGTEPAHALVLEDSEYGILAAANAGIPVVCIPDMKQPAPEYASKAGCILPDAFALIRLLDQASAFQIP